MMRTHWLAGAGAAALLAAQSVQAQDAGSVAQEPAAAQEGPATESRDIVVLGRIRYRNRTEAAEPALIYDTEYFQRFEPLTAGDALKRVPSVTFLSDVIESDGARLRGLDPGYTQILINGEKVPGSGVDRSFFLDRIPAELLDRVEIARSSSARRTADAVAGTLNIVLRDAFELDGGYVKAGGLRFDDGELKPALGAVWGGRVGGGRMLLGGTFQGRYNPKKKQSFRYGDSPENTPDFETEEFDNREDQDDTRDGTDTGVNGSYGIDLGSSRLELNGFYNRTDRTETERSFEYDDPSAESGPILNGGNLLTDNKQVVEIDQDNFNLDGKFGHDWSLGKTSLRVAYARFAEDVEDTEVEIDFDTDEDPALFEGARILRDISDREVSLGLDHAFPLGADFALVLGVFGQNKRRDSDIQEAEDEFELSDGETAGYDQFGQDPADLPASYVEFEAVTGGLSGIEEDRRDIFALVEGRSGIVRFEAGARYENTKVRIEDMTVDPELAVSSDDCGMLLPSASAKIDLTGQDRLTFSAARTNRRPRFDYISPALLEAELGENDLLGNPDLRPETAWGLDVGYERRIGRSGVAGVNVFYRAVSDLVGIANTGFEGSEGEGTFVLQPRNTGDGKAWGIEFDLSSSLEFAGLADTGIFGNLALLDSEVQDFMGDRRFNGQPKYVYNVGFIQDLPSFGAAFGATYRKQGAAVDRFVGQEVRTTYGADLEVFVEKRFGRQLTIRAVGSNLLNARKREVFNNFETIDDQLERNFDEYELEAEEAGPVFQLIARTSF